VRLPFASRGKRELFAMRAVVLALAILAGVKIWTQDRLFRAATEDALIAAYRDRAVAACGKDAGRNAAAWLRPASVRLQIGRPDVAVDIWDVHNALWDVRYKQPVLLVSTTEEAGPAECIYDVTIGAATVRRG
jgi:hypothetical protein